MQAPEWVDWAGRERYEQAARDFFRRSPDSRAQETFDFPPAWRDPSLRDAIDHLAGGLCAYCESPPGADAGEVEPRHVRPHDGVISQLGSTSQMFADLYWWLAYDPDNLVLACTDCHARKGKRFPIHGERVQRPTPIGKLDEIEQPVLVHPAALADRLAFGADGHVSGLDEDARQTISIIQLNRPWLVRDRRAAYDEVAAAVADDPALLAPDIDLVAHYPDDVPHHHARRQAHRDAVERLSGPVEAVPDSIQIDWGATTKARHVVSEAQTEQKAHDARLATADVTKDESFFTARTIERVEVKNFKIIDHLVLELKGQPSEWRMLLGENGTGKSTLIQALALTLVDRDYRERLGVDPATCLRRGCKRGYIEVQLAGTDSPIRLEFGRDIDGWGGTADDPNTQVLGYGSTRLLPRSEDDPVDLDSRFARTANLFNPFVALRDAEQWLLDQHRDARDRFHAAARLLRQLLDEQAEARLRVRSDRIELRENGSWKHLDQLSDGYQTVVALALDMMAVLSELWPDMSAAEGVVLIDELGSHLHPRWQMRIVTSLRNAFPRLQFIVSTHNPLCLRGLEEGEVVLMRRRLDDPRRVIAVTELPSMIGLRVDQLLTSPHFGLGTTMDESIERDFQRMYQLQTQVTMTADERTELAALERRLAGKERLGDTPAQGELYRAINDLLLQHVDDDERPARRPLRPVTHQRIVDMLKRIDAERAASARRGAAASDRIPL